MSSIGAATAVRQFVRLPFRRCPRYFLGFFLSSALSTINKLKLWSWTIAFWVPCPSAFGPKPWSPAGQTLEPKAKV